MRVSDLAKDIADYIRARCRGLSGRDMWLVVGFSCGLLRNDSHDTSAPAPRVEPSRTPAAAKKPRAEGQSRPGPGVPVRYPDLPDKLREIVRAHPEIGPSKAMRMLEQHYGKGFMGYKNFFNRYWKKRGGES